MKKIMMLIGVSALLLGVVAFGLWKMLQPDEIKPLPGALTAEELLEYTVDTGDVTTNLRSGGFIQIRFQLQGDSVETKAELTNRMFQIRNIIIHSLASMKREDLKGAEGITALEQTIQAEINEQLPDGEVLKVFTTKKLLQ